MITFVAKGDLASPRLHEEIQAREHRLVELERQLERLHTARPSVPAPIDSGWVHQKLDALNQLLARDSPGQSSIVAPVARGSHVGEGATTRLSIAEPASIVALLC